MATEPILPPRSEQALRDVERLRILRDELSNEQMRASEVAKRRAERLAAGDLKGVDEADRAHVRSATDIEALKREIAGVEAAARPPPRIAAAKRTENAWWDVYTRPRTASPSSVASTPASPAEGAMP